MMPRRAAVRVVPQRRLYGLHLVSDVVKTAGRIPGGMTCLSTRPRIISVEQLTVHDTAPIPTR